MILCKNFNPSDTISNIGEWYQKCPPARPEHWADGRSAKTTAEIWLSGVPTIFEEALKSLGFCADICSPEYVSRFDNYGGNGRNHDLVFIDKKNKTLVCVESKVDEHFDKTIQERIRSAYKELEINPNSKTLMRIADLRNAVFGDENELQLNLRYQLLFGIAGSISEAAKQNCTRAVFLVQVLKTKLIDKEKNRVNKNDLDNFIKYLTNNTLNTIENGELIQIGNLPGNVFIPNIINLYIAKIEIEVNKND